MNNLIVQHVVNGDTYKYLGQDENIAYVGEVNKEKVRKELYARCRKVWSSELSAYNKTTAHNIFVISIITPTFGIIDWSIEELKEIEKRTRFIRFSFHPNSDIDRLYIPRYQGGRGLKSVISLFECRIVTLYNHLQTHKNRNEYVNYVYQEEQSQSIRVGIELINKNNVVTTPTDTPKQAGKKLLRRIQEEKIQTHTNGK